MRCVRVVTNETCNLQCSFCDARRPHERASVAAAPALRARLDAAAGADEIVLTGGEPTLRSDLAGVIQRAARAAQRVVVETNATQITAADATAWANAGLTAARVHVPAHGDALDAITGASSVWDRVREGIAHLVRAHVDVQVAIPIVAGNVDTVAAIPAALRAAGIVPSQLWIRVVLRSPDRSSIAERDAAARAIGALADAARQQGLRATLDPATFVPPCQLRHPARHASLFALNKGGATRDGYRRRQGCRGCGVADRCPGLPEDAPGFADAIARPLRDDSLRRRLTLIENPERQIERELVTRETHRRPDGTTAHAHVIRVNFRCNQACTFCFVSTHLPTAADEQIEAAIARAAQTGAIVVLSGGEPTINPKLPHWVALAKAQGAPEVEVQTNATMLGRRGQAHALAQAGVDRAFVSLHANTATTSDALTGAPGTFVQTLAGLDALAQTTIAVRINYVLCRPNATEFPAFVDRVAASWPGAAITVSFVGMSTDLVPRTGALVPRYAEVLDPLRDGLARADRHGVVADGFDSMCGLPLCLVPLPPSDFVQLAPAPPGDSAGEFVHPPPCQRCGLRAQCFGLRRGYAQMYGWDELRPVPREP